VILTPLGLEGQNFFMFSPSPPRLPRYVKDACFLLNPRTASHVLFHLLRNSFRRAVLVPEPLPPLLPGSGYLALTVLELFSIAFLLRCIRTYSL